jgi:glycosyltransferase involved in cell wall biosynthesis
VTPFYNTRDYLSECIESVLRQTYENWEYILVDNCSTDGSGEIAWQYASRCPAKIRLIHTESFLSQVQNYNFALSCVSHGSRYCKMVQADDWIFPDCLRSMVEAAEAHPTAGVVGAYALVGEAVEMNGLPYPSPEVSGRDVCRLFLLKDKYLFGTPTSLLMRSDVVRSRVPFYDERFAPFEDAHACFDILRSWNFGFVHQVLTFSRRDNDSILLKIQPFGGFLFSRFALVVAHGRDYLSEEEYTRCVKEAARPYFTYLAKYACALHPAGREFWKFHRKGLESINYSLDWKVLGKWIPRALLQKTWDAWWAMWDGNFRPARG